MPIAYRIADGNTVDDVTHIPTWDGLVGLVGRTDFLYVADCKLASRQSMDHIAARGGRFLTVLPASRKEDAAFRGWIQAHTPAWVEVSRRPARRSGGPDEVCQAAAAPAPSAEGYRIVWIRSSSKTVRDANARSGRVHAGLAALEDLAARLGGPKTRLRTRVAVDQAAAAALTATGAARWINVEVTETEQAKFRQEPPGRPGPNTTYRKTTRTRYGLSWSVRDDVVAYDAASDGCFPLITNDTTMTDAELLAAYKYQPNLEKRHAQLKGVQLVAPVLLHDPARIEGLLCAHFIAMLIQALIERAIRQAMTARSVTELALYHEGRACKAPTAARVLATFDGIARHHLYQDGELVQIFHPTLTPLQQQVLDLLDIPTSVYTAAPVPS